MTKVLLLEDETTIAHQIKDFLKAKGMHCQIAFDGEIFLKLHKTEAFDIFLLDINVPKINGLDICKTIRIADSKSPIIMLTAFGEIEEKVEAFKYGADDYLVKPFLLEELHIRIEALLRRKQNPISDQNLLQNFDLNIDTESKTVWRNGKEVKLTPKEYKLLHLLVEANGRVLSKKQISEALWDYNIDASENTIEVYINFLRNKIDKAFEKKLIHTKVGFGYYLKIEE